MKFGILASVLVFGSVAMAGQAPELGHFKGLAFSSPTSRHNVEINGGTLSNCAADARKLEVTHCEVENGFIKVTGGEENALDVKLVRVAFARIRGEVPSRHYYYRGTTEIKIGEKLVPAILKVTLNVDETDLNRLFGSLNLIDQYTQSSLEAYRVNP